MLSSQRLWPASCSRCVGFMIRLRAWVGGSPEAIAPKRRTLRPDETRKQRAGRAVRVGAAVTKLARSPSSQGRLQFEVLQYRLRGEYSVETKLEPLPCEDSAPPRPRWVPRLRPPRTGSAVLGPE